MLRSADTGLLVLQTPEEKASLQLLFSSKGWMVLDAAIQMYTTLTHEQLAGVSFPALACETEAGRQLGRLQGKLEAFSEVLGDLREQLVEPPEEPGVDTVEGESLSLPVSTPPQHQGGSDGIEF